MTLPLAQIPNGTTLEVLDDSNAEWLKVKYSGKIGYVMSSFTNAAGSEDNGSSGKSMESRVKDLEETVADMQEKLDRLTNEWENKMGWG